MLRRIYEDSNLAQTLCQFQQEASFKGIAIRISGVNTATAATLADIGRVQFIKNGTSIIDAGFDALIQANHVMGGNPKDTSVASGELDLFLYIPRRFNDNNVETVIPSDNAHITITHHANLDTRVASAGKVEVYLDIEQGVQKYDMAIRQYSETMGGAGVRPVALDQPNIMGVFIGDTESGVFTLDATNISQLTCEVGSDTSDLSIGALEDYTNVAFNLEADFDDMGVMYFASGDVTSRLFDNVRISFTTTGAAQPETLIYSALYEPKRLKETANKQASRLRSIMTSKKSRNQLATVAAVNTLSNRMR